MLTPSPRRLVRFGAFEFDPASGDLSKAGRRVRLQNQPRQVLKLLVANAGELVTREELRRQLWPDDTFVDFDNGLNVAIRKIRDALGDLAPSPRFIETERAQGYRFVAPVSDVAAPGDAGGPLPRTNLAPVEQAQQTASGFEPAAAPTDRTAAIASPGRPQRVMVKWPAPRHTSALLVALAATAVAGAWQWRAAEPASTAVAEPQSGALSLAVLPLAGGSDPDGELLAAGISDGIVSRLSNASRFRVRSTSAMARYSGQDIDPQQVGRNVASQYVLVGALRTTADRVRVSVQLVETATGSPVWGNRYDVARGDLLEVEDAVASEIASALRLRLSDAERERFERRYTRSGAAYERYLMGRARLRAANEQDVRLAIEEFEAARELDPDFAPAYAGIATAAAQLRVRYASIDGAAVWDARARREAGRALELDPGLAEAHVALAAVHRFQEYDWDTVIRESTRAVALNPSLDLPHLYLAAAYFHLGLLQEAESEIAAARQLNPEGRVEPLETLGAIHLYAGRPAEAIRYLSQADEVSDSRITKYLLAWALYNEGERHRAEAMLDAMGANEGPVSGNARATLAAVLAARGARSEARALAARVASEPDLIHHGAYGLGTAYAQLHDPVSALRWLSQAVTTGFACYPWYERDPLLDPIRTDARFDAFMDDLRRSWESAKVKYASGS